METKKILIYDAVFSAAMYCAKCALFKGKSNYGERCQNNLEGLDEMGAPGLNGTDTKKLLDICKACAKGDYAGRVEKEMENNPVTKQILQLV